MAPLTTYTLDGPVATITMDDGKVNALSIAMLGELHAALDRAKADEAVVVLAGRPGRFSAGFDLAGFTSGLDPLVEMLRLGATLLERMLGFPRPIIVACTGHALAAGAFLCLAADARIGVDGPFQLGLNEVRIGLTVPHFGIELARYRMQPTHFDRAIVSAQLYTPADAIAAGFLDAAAAPDDLQSAVLAAATHMAGLNATAHAATKLRARGAVLAAMRSAIETELTPEGLSNT